MTLEEKIRNYKPNKTVQKVVRDSSILLIAGVVCAGKNTILNELVQQNEYTQFISHTTRQPRENHGVMETDGVEYHFISLDEAQHMVDEQSFIEVKYVHGNVYGTSLDELLRIKQAHKTAVNDVDIQGVEEYLELAPDIQPVFLLPPSVETWLARMEKRYGSLDRTNPDIITRFQTAKEEIERVKNDPRFIIIINDDLKTTTNRIEMIMKGERHETSEYAHAVMDHLLEYIALNFGTH